MLKLFCSCNQIQTDSNIMNDESISFCGESINQLSSKENNIFTLAQKKFEKPMP